MSTYRDISTLPLDALRSSTYSATRKSGKSPISTEQGTGARKSPVDTKTLSSAAMSYRDKSSILATNEKLYEENRQLRRCISLILENSQLKTVSLLSSVMSMYDDRLRTFTTDKLIYDVPLDQSLEKGNHSLSFNEQKSKRVSSSSYGKSFDKLNLSDLGNSTIRSSSYYKTASPRKGHSPASFEKSSQPPMKFGYGPSPYQRSPTKTVKDHSLDTKSNRSEEYRYQSKIRSKSRSPVREDYSVTVDTKETRTQTKSPVVSFSEEPSPPARPLSAPASSGPFTSTTIDEFKGTKAHNDVIDSQHKTSVRHCRQCGINLLPMCGCQSFKTSPKSDETIGILKSTKYTSGTETSGYSNGGPADDRSGTVYKERVSKTINYTRSPVADRTTDSQNNGDVVEEFRREKKKYERILSSTNEPQVQSTQTTKVEVSMTGKNLPTDTDDTEGTSVDIEDLAEEAAPVSYVKEKHNSSYGRIGLPLATSTPIQSPAGNSTRSMLNTSSRLTPDIIANMIGMSGRGASEKANYVLHRPVDVLIGYTPNISDEASLSLAYSKPNQRIVGEVAFQLDRRILEFVFGRTNGNNSTKRRSRYYGYSVATIMLLIQKEARQTGNILETERSLRTRLTLIEESLLRFGYNLKRHGEFTQDMVNKYGLMGGSPEPNTVEGLGLCEPAVLRVLLGQILKDTQELDDMLVILDSLHYMSHLDKRPLFIW